MRNFKSIQKIYSLVFLLLLTFAFAGLTNTTYAQKSVGSLLNAAKKKQSKLDYPEAISFYKEALSAEPENTKALEGLIEIYLYRYEIYDSAKTYIDRRLALMEKNPNEKIYFDNANCLRLQEKPYEAIKQYIVFKEKGMIITKYESYEEEVNKHMQSCRYSISNKGKDLRKASYTVENMDFFINSVDPEYTPVYMEEDSLLLYNARYKDFESEEAAKEDNKYYENIYYFDLEESVASSYNPGIEQENHHAVVGRVTGTDSIVVFYKNHTWISKINEDRLKDVEPLPEILTRYYFQPHGIFTNGGNTFIFSAMKVTRDEGGNLDIYISNKVDGKWQTPRSISPILNSDQDEDSPYLTEDGKTLYFSSKGHNSSGGYDFFKSELVGGQWTYPENLGYPMNSAGDDIYLSFAKDGKSGFFSSNRTGGFGGMDIYRFEIGQKVIAGTVTDISGNPISNARVTLTGNSDEPVSVMTNQAGEYTFNLDANQTFKLEAEKEDFLLYSATGNSNTKEQYILKNIELRKDPGLSLLGFITDNETSQPLADVKMMITDNMTGISESYTTNSSGEYRKELRDKLLNDRGSYNITLEKNGYNSKTVTYNKLFDKSGVYNIHDGVDLSMNKYVPGGNSGNGSGGNNIVSNTNDNGNLNGGQNSSNNNNQGGTTGNNTNNNTSSNNGNNTGNGNTTSIAGVKIQPIYFDLNKSNIRPDAALELDKIVKLMNENPNMVIELSSHTDSRGSTNFNQRLSDRRAASSAKYIKDRISNPERISGKGYGESKLVNYCTDKNDCNEKQHQNNRRTEFVIVRM